MSEQTVDSPAKGSAAETLRPRRRLPRVMVVVTIIVAIGIFLSQRVFLFEMEEYLGLGKDMVNLLAYLLIMLTFVAWFITIAFFSGWTIKTRVLGILGLIALPVIFIALGPVNDGDVGIARFEPFWMSKPQLNEVESSDKVDLSADSQFDFPQFLGPHQHARAAFLELDTEKFKYAKELWKIPIGKGWSGFVARNGFAVTMEQRGKMECVTCYNIETGALEWMYEHQARHQDAMNLGRVGPRATPTIYQGNVYAMGANGNLVCLNGSDGSVVWQKDLNSILGIKLATGKDRDGFEYQWEENTSLAWGRSGSPLILAEENLVVVPGGGPKDNGKTPTTLLAFNLSNGELVWKGGNEMIAYGSPVLETLVGVRQILLVAESSVMGFSPEDGTLLWSHPRPGESNAMANCSQPTVVNDHHILTSKGYPDGGGELFSLDLILPENRLVPRTFWKNPRVLKTKFTNPVVFDGHVYAISNGFLECTELSSGERTWKHRKRLKNGQIFRLNNYVLTHSEDGEMRLVELNPVEYVELGSFKTIDGLCWNTICLHRKYLVVRSDLEAACFELDGELKEDE